MRNKLLLSALAIFGFLSVRAQYSEYISTDRPCATMNPVSIGQNVLQMQTGYSLSQFSGGDLKTVSNTFDTKIRYGIFERIDISFQTSGGTIKETGPQDFIINESTDLGTYGFNARWLIYKGEGAVPAVGLEMGSRTIRLGDSDKLNHTLLATTLSLSSSFGDHLSGTVNVISVGDNVLEFTLNLAYALNSDLGFIIEYYPRYLMDNLNYNQLYSIGSYLNGGAYYNISKNFQLDIAGFWLVTDGALPESLETSGFQFQLGFTGRVDWRE
jgi:hypothetical protein